MSVSNTSPLTNWLIDVGSNQDKYCKLLELSQLHHRFGVSGKDFKMAMDSQIWKARSCLSPKEIETIWVFLLRQDLFLTALQSLPNLTNYQRIKLTKVSTLTAYVLPIFCLDYYVRKHILSLEAGYVLFFSNSDRKAKPSSKSSEETRQRRAFQRQILKHKTYLRDLQKERAKIENLDFIEKELQHPDLLRELREVEAE
jgi:hypothetical protein